MQVQRMLLKAKRKLVDSLSHFIWHAQYSFLIYFDISIVFEIKKKIIKVY